MPESLPHSPDMREWLEQRLQEMKDQGQRKSKTGLAKAMGITAPRITEILNGTRSIKSGEIPAMADYLDWSVDELLKKIIGDNPTLAPVRDRIVKVPLISWVQAGKYTEISDPYEPGDYEREVEVPYGKDTLIALKIQGNSTNRVAPDGSIVIVDYSEKVPQTGRLYVVKHGEEATCKRYKATPDRFEPDSTEPFETIFPDGDTEIVGRVVKVIIDV